jgi:hypothetical protein
VAETVLTFQHISTQGVAERHEAGAAHRWRIDVRARVPVDPCVRLQPPGPILGRPVALPFIRTECAAAGITDAEVAAWVARLADDTCVESVGSEGNNNFRRAE